MEPPEPPLVVLVHGAWHGAWCWSALQVELDSRGIPSLAIDLPGHGSSIEPLGDLAGDAAAVSALVASIARPIVLVGHSYGGAVISEMATLHNVTHLVYIAAFVTDVGESVISLSASLPQEPTALSDAIVIGDGITTVVADRAHDAFYGNCDPVVTGAHIARLCPQPIATVVQPATNASWRHVPSTYVRCTADAAVALSNQDVMAARCTNVETLDADHSPFASMPAETAEIIARIVRG